MDRISSEFIKLTASDLERCAQEIKELSEKIVFRRKLRWDIEGRAWRVMDLADRLREIESSALQEQSGD